MRSNSGGSDIVSNESPCIDLVHRVSFFCFQPLPSISFLFIHLYSFIVNVFACTFVSVVVLASPCSPYLFAIVNISFMNLKCVSSFFPFVSFFYLLTCGLTVTIHFSISCRIVCLMLDKRFHCFVLFFILFVHFSERNFSLCDLTESRYFFALGIFLIVIFFSISVGEHIEWANENEHQEHTASVCILKHFTYLFNHFFPTV